MVIAALVGDSGAGAGKQRRRGGCDDDSAYGA